MSDTALDGLLTVGFVSLAIAIWIALHEPATAYESSIYLGTPTFTWIALALVFAVAVGVTLSCDGPYQGAGILLGGTGVVAIVSLPITRSYRFLGKADALTHIGWTRDILVGDLLPHELFYPALHGLSALLSLLSGITLERAMLLVVVFTFIPFLIFVPLVTRQLSGSTLAVGLGAIVSWFILPVNNVATHFSAHTNTNALFFVPVVLFAAFALMRRDNGRDRLSGLSSFSLLLLLTGVTLLLLHPQQMVNVLVLLGAIVLVQRSIRNRADDHPILDHASPYPHAVVLGLLFTIWSLGNDRFRDAAASMVVGLFSADVGAGAEVQQRGGSLAELGGSMAHLFVTMFGPAALVGLFVGGLVLLAWTGRMGWDAESRSLVVYCGAAIVPLGAIFGVYFLGTPTMAFRQLGFIYVVVTVLAGLAFASWLLWAADRLHMTGAHASLATVLAICLALSLVTVFASPIIYSPNQQSTDAMAGGYETALSGSDHDHPMVGLGYGVDRYDHATFGVENRGEDGVVVHNVVDPDVFESGNYSGAFGAETYHLFVSAYDEEREFAVYSELHHSAAALEGVEHYPGSSLAVSNDEFRMYVIEDE